jgi:hypothetical protein
MGGALISAKQNRPFLAHIDHLDSHSSSSVFVFDFCSLLAGALNAAL